MADKTIRISNAGGSLPAGTRLSDNTYELEKVVAAGGMGEVYRARLVQTGDVVAIKMIKPEFAGDEAILALFRKEASALYSLSHDTIVRYFNFSVDRRLGRPYLAMEFVDGPSLKDRLRQGPLTLDQINTLRRRIASGLQAAHDQGIIHRDMSPDNIILPKGDIATAKIIDFGIARTEDRRHVSVIGSGFAGKLSYVSPEQLGMFAGKVSNRSDIYSLGLVLAEAARGRPLDMSGNDAQVIEKRSRVPDLTGIDWRLRPLLTRMLQPDPQKRIASMAEVTAWEVSGVTAITAIGRTFWRPASFVLVLLAVLTGAAYGGYGLYNRHVEESKPESADARRKVEAQAVAKRAADDAEARRKTEAEAAAKRAADDAEARRKVEAEAAAKRAAGEAETRRKMEAEATARRATEAAEAQRKVEAEATARRATEEAEARRKVEAEAAARRATEEAEARRKVEAEATARRATEAAEARRKVEAEATARRATEEAEARRKVEAEAAARRATEEAEARRKVEAEATARRATEAAEARRKVEAEAAARRATEAAEARRKVEAEATARRATEAAEAQRKVEVEATARRATEEAEARRKVEAEAAAKRATEEAEARRKVEAEATAKRAAEEAEARRKVEAEATAKRAVEAVEARRKVEAEAAAKRVAEEAEARRKIEAEAAAKRAAEEAETRRKMEAEAAAKRAAEVAEARRKLEAEAAAKQTAEEAEARRKVEAEAAAKRAVDAQTERMAEAVEIALRFTPVDRQRLQIALTSLGFDTRGIDGAFGARSRQMILEWQRSRHHPETGFLIAPQRQQLLLEAATAVARYDEEIRKADEERKRADAAAKRSVPAAAAATPPAPPAPRVQNSSGVVCQDSTGRRISFASATSCPYGLTRAP